MSIYQDTDGNYRNSDGTFVNGLGLNASQNEQIDCLVNKDDNYWSACEKVCADRAKKSKSGKENKSWVQAGSISQGRLPGAFSLKEAEKILEDQKKEQIREILEQIENKQNLSVNISKDNKANDQNNFEHINNHKSKDGSNSNTCVKKKFTGIVSVEKISSNHPIKVNNQLSNITVKKPIVRGPRTGWKHTFARTIVYLLIMIYCSSYVAGIRSFEELRSRSLKKIVNVTLNMDYGIKKTIGKHLALIIAKDGELPKYFIEMETR